MSGTGRFIWYELMTKDVEAAKAFYTGALGWSTEEWPGETPYTVLKAGETGIGGIMALPPELEEAGVPPHWVGYVYVEDVDAATDRARELGGAIRLPGTDIPEVGRFAVIADPQGAVLNIMHPTGPDQDRDMRHVGDVGWHELNTTDSESALGFYGELFGWALADTMDMGEQGLYRIFRHPDDPADPGLGGMSDLALHMGAPPHWLYYINVAGIDAALDRIRSGGGAVLNGPMDVPGGRIGQCQDPQGGYFAVFAQEESAEATAGETGDETSIPTM
jgi:predicted enzyme related to lactoylglutathione lyase